MARSYLDKIGLGHLWDLIKSYFVKGNAKVFTGTCFSDASATDKVVTCSEFASTDLVVGAIISVKFTNTNSATASTITLNVNNTGSKGIRYIYNGSLNTIPSGNYLKANQLYQFTYDGTYWVVQLVYDTNTTSSLRDDYGRYKAGSIGLFPYTLVMQLPDGRWESIVTSSSGGTSKIKNSHGFLTDTILYKGSNSTVTENNLDSTWYIYEHPNVCDYRYSFNIENTTALALIAGNPIYLVGTIKADGLFYLDDIWWTQTLPLTEDGKVYIYLGQVFDWYRGTLLTNHPIYWYKDGHVTNYINNDSAVNADQQPYGFRKSGGGVVVGDTEYDKIVGASVVMNQQAAEGTYTNTVTDTRAMNLRLQSKTSGNPFVVLTGTTTVGVLNKIVSPTWTGESVVKHNGASQDLILINYLDVVEGHKYLVSMNLTGVDTSVVGGVVADKRMFIDLTQFFGSVTIPNYVYSLEQANTGDGVAWLRKYFPKVFDNGYIPYNTGSFEHVSGLSEHKMVGFNQFDKSKATLGKYINKGEEQADSKCFISDYIHVLPNTTYYVNHMIGTAIHSIIYACFDTDKNYISQALAPSGSGEEKAYTIDVDANTHYIRFNGLLAKIDETNFNLSDPTKNGTYEPYSVHSYALDSSLTFKGKFELDENNDLIADGDTYEANGKVTGRYGIVDLGTLTWAKDTSPSTEAGYNVYYAGIPNALGKFSANGVTTVCSKYVSINVYAHIDKTCRFGSTSANLMVWDSALNGYTLAQVKEAMSGVYLVYEKATPTTEQATPYQNPQSVNEYGTEEYISTSIIPIGHYTEYPASKKLIKNITNNYNDIATQNKMGYMSASDKTKLDGIATGAEVNQNAFSNVKVGTTTIFSNTKTDTLELVAGSNITLTPDTTNDKVTIAMTSNMVIQNIASNANLNTITTDGWYMASTDAIASSLSNCPSTKSFLMEVYHINSATGSNEVIYQKISTSENIHYERVKSGGVWSEWKSSCHIDLNGVVYI